MPPKPHTQKTSTKKAQKLTWSTAGRPKNTNLQKLATELKTSKIDIIDNLYPLPGEEPVCWKIITDSLKKYYECSMDVMKISRSETTKRTNENTKTYHLDLQLYDFDNSTKDLLFADLVGVLERIAKWMIIQEELLDKGQGPTPTEMMDKKSSGTSLCLRTLKYGNEIKEAMEERYVLNRYPKATILIQGAINHYAEGLKPFKK